MKINIRYLYISKLVIKMNGETITVLTYNIFMGPIDGETLCVSKRLVEIIKALTILNKKTNNSIDVICFQEFWDSFFDDYGLGTIGKIIRFNGISVQYKNFFIRSLKNIGFKYHITIGRCYGKFKNGGLLIVSKHPIVNYDEYYYSGSELISVDALSSKGILWAKIKKKNLMFNIFNTHYQAWPSHNITRILQTLAFKKFINKLSIPKNEPIIIAGDLNEDYYHFPERTNVLFHILNVKEPQRIGDLMYTYNINNPLVGLDGSKLNYSQKIDYILYSEKGRKPKKSFYQVIKLLSQKKYLAIYKDLIFI